MDILAQSTLTDIAQFWSLEYGAVRTALAGVVLLGISCGMLGCFVVLRRLSLMGDSLGHAVLPGVCLGFLVNKTKDPLWIFLGAVLSAWLGSWLIGLIQRQSKLKPDTAMGLVLSGFFGFGVVLLTRLQNFPYGNQSGLNQFLFGQASAINERDLWLIGSMSIVIVGTVLLGFKELALTSFDAGFATAIGLPTRAIHYSLMLLIALAIVISIQAVGVVLLSAMLITPAATAYLLTDRLRVMVLISVLCATFAGIVGLNLSFLERSLPTGPFIVVTLTVLFLAAYLFSPRYGTVTRWWRRRKQTVRTQRENVLKSIYSATQQQSASSEIEPALSLAALAEHRREPIAQMPRLVAPLVSRGWVTLDGDRCRLTERGLQRARELVRNYQLWELFLTREINIPYDHTQRDAEDIEHILGPELVHELETELGMQNTTIAKQQS